MTTRKSLEQYLADEEQDGIIDHNLRIIRNKEGDLHFYIHPSNHDGETCDFAVQGNRLLPIESAGSARRDYIKPILGS